MKGKATDLERIVLGTVRLVHYPFEAVEVRQLAGRERTPNSADRGFDIAARKHGRQIPDEAKAYKPSLFVNRQIVRTVVGLLVLMVFDGRDR